MNKYYLTYTITMADTKEYYYIEVSENDSILKAKNLLSKVVYPRLMEAMKIADPDLIKKEKSNMIKSIKKNIYEAYSNIQEGYTAIEVKGNITKTDNLVTIKNCIKNKYGEIEFREVQGEKYKSKVFPNIDLYFVKMEYGKGYYLIDANTGVNLISVSTKNKIDIEARLSKIEKEFTENEIIKRHQEISGINVAEEIETENIVTNETNNIDVTPVNNIIEAESTQLETTQYTHNEIIQAKLNGTLNISTWYEVNQLLYTSYSTNKIKPIFTPNELYCIESNDKDIYARIVNTIKELEWQKELMLSDIDLRILDKLQDIEKKLIELKEKYIFKYTTIEMKPIPIKPILKYNTYTDVITNYIGIKEANMRESLAKTLLDIDYFASIKDNYNKLLELKATGNKVNFKNLKQYELLVNKLEPIFKDYYNINAWMEQQTI